MATRPWQLEFLSFHLPSLIVEARIGVYTRCCHLSGQKSGWIWRKFAGNCIKAPSHIRSMVCCFYSAKHVLDHSPKTDTQKGISFCPSGTSTSPGPEIANKWSPMRLKLECWWPVSDLVTSRRLAFHSSTCFTSKENQFVNDNSAIETRAHN